MTSKCVFIFGNPAMFQMFSQRDFHLFGNFQCLWQAKLKPTVGGVSFRKERVLYVWEEQRVPITHWIWEMGYLLSAKLLAWY